MGSGRHEQRRLFLDESGDHTLGNSMEPGKQFLGLVGVAMSLTEAENLQARLEAIKCKHIPGYDPRRPKALHRTDITGRAGPFSFLRDEASREAWDADLLKLVADTRFIVIAVVIDKLSCATKEHWRQDNWYHYGLELLLERYCGALRYYGVGDLRGDVVAEGRGGREDLRLKEEYRQFYLNGSRVGRPRPLTAEDAQRSLYSDELKVEPKRANVGGLQLADILAHPVTRDVVRAHGIESVNPPTEYARRLMEVVEPKYNRRIKTGEINGFGRKLCP